MNKLLHIVPGITLATLAATPAMAQEATVESVSAKVDFFVGNLWLLIAAGLVFLMHLGFATLEAGLTQQKNTVNILFKNVFIICMGTLAYALWGFHAMYPTEWLIENVVGSGASIENAFLSADSIAANLTAEGYGYPYTYWTDFIFQAMFAATAATIISGAVAERIKLGSFMIAATIIVLIGYPITGSWEWGGGWLDQKDFADFAGSSLVHAFGGFAALAAVLVLGPRKGKYLKNGKIKPILGHSMPLATIGVFLLFLGWFGFNGGSVLSGDPAGVSQVFVTTALAACGGGLASVFISWGVLKKPDLSMALNGILAGLVGITAGADVMGAWGAVLVGLTSGIIVVFSIIFFDKIRIDDPVGAISVHGICGIWGTLCVSIFGLNSVTADAGITFGVQLLGAVSVSAFAFIFSFAVFSLVKVIIGIRVSEEEEFEGLDVGEHGQEAYPDFSVITR